MKNFTRRSFIHYLGMSTAAVTIPSSVSALDLIHKKYEGKKINVALVGLGTYANLIANGISNGEYCQVAGIVTGTPSKAETWSKKYNLPAKNVYNYQNFDTIKNNKDIDLIYITLPNSMHHEFVIRSAKAGKNVITEKPMATSVKECEAMIKACKDAGVQLGVGYRLHFEPFNQEIKRLGQEKVFGRVKLIEASFGFQGSNPNQWRLKKALSGGGPLMDVGIYALQATRYVLGEEPISVTAQFGPITKKEMFAEVEESVRWQLEFPGGAISNSITSYNANIERFFASCENGFFELSPAYGYGPLKGRTSKGELTLPIVNHQTAQMDAIGKLLVENKPFPAHFTGEEGLKDVRIMMAIYDAAKTGKKIKLSW